VHQIRAELSVGRPPLEARRHLDAFFKAHPIIALHVELAAQDDSTLAIERDVKVRLGLRERGQNGGECTRVAWGPCEGGPFLPFEATVEIRSDEDPRALRLVLSGSYVPPDGIARTAFDFIVGRRIAMATARELLLRMRTEIEGAYLESGSGKALRGAAG
jgi:hypothetical protein